MSIQITMSEEEFNNIKRNTFKWPTHLNFEKMSPDEMKDVFSEHRKEARIDQVLSAIPFKNEILYLEEVMYMLSWVFTWYDVPEQYDININTKANYFLRHLYPHTDEFLFVSNQSIVTFINLYNKILPLERKRDLMQQLVERIVDVEDGDEEQYKESYELIKRVNGDGCDDIIQKYLLIAALDSREINEDSMDVFG